MILEAPAELAACFSESSVMDSAKKPKHNPMITLDQEMNHPQSRSRKGLISLQNRDPEHRFKLKLMQRSYGNFVNPGNVAQPINGLTLLRHKDTRAQSSHICQTRTYSFPHLSIVATSAQTHT